MKDLSPLQSQLLANYLETVRNQVSFSEIEQIPYNLFERKLLELLDKWDREKNFLEGFLSDIVETFCYEFNLTR